MKCEWCGHELTILDVEWGRCLCEATIPLATKEAIVEAFDAERDPDPLDEHNADYVRDGLQAVRNQL